jgi:pilus assembly protein CpaC
VIDAEHVSLTVRPEVSELTTQGQVTIDGTTIPGLSVRRAETTVELASGASFALAGLLQNDITQNITKVPGLGDIPVIGQLFRSESFQRNETELVIIVTAYLVKPSQTRLAAPTDGFIPPHDAQQVLNGDLYRQSLPAAASGPLGPSGEGLAGPVGFQLD